ncbi:unnamed protein product [Adineta steineri]|uniref:Acyl-coenzyme A thioesterase 13 n=1 Tax=Adineta steineri TaxID=433720 RepID=A0A818MHF7_9BILA|nr:unnamed protein product [Adineta steineri]CAF1157769.1 unnamed protein product [Adineta steineri]CAF3585456.1 unnamed protein product [Adineta steineri]CAF3603008.1 unnamed protein product [Adineta steineri]
MSTSRNLLRTLQDLITLGQKSEKFNRIFDGIRVVSSRKPGHIQCELDIEERHLNRNDTLHGGMISSLTDSVSTLALETIERKPLKSASIELSVSFLKAAKKGETILIDAETVKLGRTLAFLSVEFRNKQNNELLATGKHTKYVS